MQAAAVTTAPPPFPVPIVELHGSADAIGAAHGERLGEPIRGLMHDYLGQ